jgi:hypothetical protein
LGDATFICDLIFLGLFSSRLDRAPFRFLKSAHVRFSRTSRGMMMGERRRFRRQGQRFHRQCKVELTGKITSNNNVGGVELSEDIRRCRATIQALRICSDIIGREIQLEQWNIVGRRATFLIATLSKVNFSPEGIRKSIDCFSSCFTLTSCIGR